jgi:hypothetical protein
LSVSGSDFNVQPENGNCFVVDFAPSETANLRPQKRFFSIKTRWPTRGQRKRRNAAENAAFPPKRAPTYIHF